MRSLWWCSLLLVLALGSSLPASAQTTRAQLTGVVTDATGAVVAGAEVTATNLATLVSQSVATNVQGIYRIQNLQPGSYRLEATMTGFKKFTQEPVTLQVGDVIGINIPLEVGQVTETVEVSASAIQVQSESASLGDVVTGRSIDELPLGIRDSFQLVFLTAGVVRGLNATYSSTQSERLQHRSSFKVGGGRQYAQEMLMDGTPNSGVDFGSAAYVPPTAMTQEFKIHTNSFSAEYGRTTGGVVDMVTKSGTAEFHGQLYEFHRNRPLDANNFFSNRAGLGRPPIRRNQFGATVGGPVPVGGEDQKTFFFFGYEGFRLATPSTGILTVPTQLQRSGDFSDTFTRISGNPALVRIYDPSTLSTVGGQEVREQFPNNRIPGNRFDSVASNVIGYYPTPTSGGDAVTHQNNYDFAGSRNVDINNLSLRVDHYFGQKNRMYGRWSRVWYNDPGFRAFPWHGQGNQDDRGLNVMIADNHSFSPTLIGDLQVSYSRHNTNQRCTVTHPFDLASLGFPADYAEQALPCTPTFGIADMSGLGANGEYIQPRVTSSAHGSVSKQFSRHFLKVGFQHRKYNWNLTRNLNSSGNFGFNRNFTQGPGPFAVAADSGHGLASFLLGTGSSGSIFIEAPLSIYRWYSAAYVQDDWKVSQRLTINLGLRWDLNRGTGERHNRMSRLDLDSRSPLSDQVGMDLKGQLEFLGNGGPSWITDVDYNDFGPRIGLAYKLTDNTVVRAGYGIFFTPLIAINNVGTQGFEAETFWVPTLDGGKTPNHLLSNPFPDGLNPPRANRDPLQDLGSNLNSSWPNDRTGYTQQWNFSIQRQLSNDLLVDVVYTGNKGTKLPWGDALPVNFVPISALDLGPAAQQQVPNPFFGIPGFERSPLAGRTVARQQLLKPYPQYNNISSFYPSVASSIYHSVQFKVEKRAAEGLYLLASYAISKQIDDNSEMRGWLDSTPDNHNPENRRADRAVTSYDAPQRLVLSYVYDLPIGKGKSIGGNMPAAANAILGGWTFAGFATFQKGQPISVTRRAFSSGQSAQLDDPTIARWFDASQFTLAPSAFSAPGRGLASYGNVGRTLPDVRADGETNFDLTASKNFNLNERIRLQFRAEFLNAFNTPQFGFPVTNLQSASVGVVSSQRNGPRSVQLGLQLYW